MLRIIAGVYKNRSLKTPKGEATRPTTAIVRKAVFDICKDLIEGATFLDLFAGTGAMGIEALSRGAKSVTFIEMEKAALKCIQENLKMLHAENESEVLYGSALFHLNRLEKKKKAFDLIYVDPPYKDLALYQEVLAFLDTTSVLSKGGVLFVEETIPSSLDIKNLALQHLEHIDTRKFGKTLLHQFIR